MPRRSETYAIIGAAGYIARRHVKVLHSLGADVKAICDAHDNVGYIEGFFPGAEFLRSDEPFFKYVKDHKISRVVVCTPNHLHFNHCVSAMVADADVVCEKPLVLSSASLFDLAKIEHDTKRNVYAILQLRPEGSKYTVRSAPWAKMNYVATRGKWYENSWKGQFDQSGGVLWNIGIHGFDLLCQLFGKPRSAAVESTHGNIIKGRIKFPKCTVQWTVGTDGAAERLIWGEDFCMNLTTTNPDAGHRRAYQEIAAGVGNRVSSLQTVTELVETLSDISRWNEDVA